MRILSIDVGIINLALVYAEITDKFVLEKIIEIHLIDITQYQHCSCKRFDHGKTISNYMKHLFYEYDYLFNSDIIIVELQPLTGLIVVEQIICYEYPKTIRVSPRSMHNYFHINIYDYNERKIKTVEIADKYLNIFENYNEITRKHDLADALCILLYFLQNKAESLYLDKVSLDISLERDKVLAIEKSDPFYNNLFKDFIYGSSGSPNELFSKFIYKKL